MITHRVFLFWLLYLVIVLFGLGVLFYLNLPQLALHHDHSYLTVLLFAMYGTAEVLSGIQAWRISRENHIADNVVRWLSWNKLGKIEASRDGGIIIWNTDGGLRHEIPRSVIAEHLTLLSVKANAGQRRI